MTKQEYIANYMTKKLKGCKLPYGMAYLNLRDATEEKAEKLWKNRKKKKKKSLM